MFHLDLFQGVGEGGLWEADEIEYIFLDDCCWEVQIRKNGATIKKSNSLQMIPLEP